MRYDAFNGDADGICALHLDEGRLLQGFALAGKQAAQRSQYAAKVGLAAA